MKSYVIQIEENNKADKEILILIIKALAEEDLKVQEAGIQQMKSITLKKKD